MGHPFIASPSCSALIKIVDNNVYLSHVTWSTYSIMLRVLKHYNFPWKTVNRTDSQKIPGFAITFSSYPTFTSSVDDFYLTSANLTITETTNNVYNDSLWNIVRNGSRNSVFTFIRGMVASRLAKTGDEWIAYFKYNNSGTTTVNTQSPSFIFCKFIEGYWTVVCGNVHQNHECNSLTYQSNSWMRRLTEVEFVTMRPLSISGTAAFNIMHFVYQSYRKRINAENVFNMRHKVFSQANLSGKQCTYLNCKR
ncbi:unnamed protein product [Schistosoma curassoni]|uniref:Phospholipase B-like n=1 Tax=Schistosoma curassoni TaxID=6186 RepID=A0A183KRV1_9TREM|nr:unnamed protein product [Schistosoma curassoni]